MQTLVTHRNQGENSTLIVVSERDLSSSTVTARLRLSGATGSGTQIGSVSGDVAGTEIILPLEVATFLAGKYELEVYADYDLSTRILLYPSSSVKFYVNLTARFSASTGIGFMKIETNFIVT